MSADATPWQPVSGCDDRCMPTAGSVPSVGALRGGMRLLAAATLVAGASLTLPMWPLLTAASRRRAQRRWCRAVLAALRVRVRVRGELPLAPPRVPVLVVSNHVSWLDTIALNAVYPLRMVARSDVRDWPLVGRLVTSSGAHYLDRARLSTLPRTVAAVAGTLRRGAAVGAFPEGTTWCGRTGGWFRPAVFQAAVDAGALIRPVAVRYRLTRTGAATTVASFVGDATLWQSLQLISRVRGLRVDVQVLPTLGPARPGPAGPRAGIAVRRALAVAATRAVHAATRTEVTSPPSLPLPPGRPDGPR